MGRLPDTLPPFRAVPSRSMVHLHLRPTMAETVALYLEREGFEDEARQIGEAMVGAWELLAAEES